jgi:hypothetical protein
MTTPDQRPVVHVVFDLSAAGSLRHALELIGRRERVIGQPDDLSLGPIDYDSIRVRLDWIDNELWYENYREITEFDNLFWSEAMSPAIHPVAWVNRRCAREYAGFLQFLWRVPHSDFEIVDITDIDFSNGKSPFAIHSLGEVAPQQIIDAGLPARQTHLSIAEIESYKAAWRKLRSENAPLRLVTSEGLVSAPITYFDDLISTYVRDDWTKCARIIGEVLIEQARGPFRQAGDLLLSTRLRKLAEAGTFESQGDLYSIRHSEVRRHRP